MKKNLGMVILLVALLSCFFITHAANAEDYYVSELKYSRLGGVLIINSEDLYSELMGSNQLPMPKFFNYYFNPFGSNPNAKLFRRFRPIVPPRITEATIVIEEDEFPAKLITSADEPNTVTIISEFLDFYTYAGSEYFPMDVEFNEKTITLQGMDLGVTSY